MDIFTKNLENSISFTQTIATLKKRKREVISATGIIDSQNAHLIYATSLATTKPCIVITSSEASAKEIEEDLRFFLGNSVMRYPAKDMVFYNADIHSTEITRQRVNILDKLTQNKINYVIVVSVDALLDLIGNEEDFKSGILNLAVGDEIKINELSKRLIEIGYEMSSLVEGPGQFAIRGGIIDIFATGHENAFRLEFWGDEIDSIRLLDTLSQRSIEKVDSVRIIPVRETIYNTEDIIAASKIFENDYQNAHNLLFKQNLLDECLNLETNFGLEVEVFKNGEHFTDLDKYHCYICKDKFTLLNFVPKEAVIFISETHNVLENANKVYTEFETSMQSRIAKGYALPKQLENILKPDEILKSLDNFNLVLLSNFQQNVDDFAPTSKVDFNVKSAGVFKSDFDILLSNLENWVKQSKKVFILSGSYGKAKHLSEELSKAELPNKFYENPQDSTSSITICVGSLRNGFVYEDAGIVFVTDHEFLRNSKATKKRNKKKETAIQSFSDLKIGDYIVHEQHGIGIYKGIEKILVDGTSKDFMKIMYDGDGVLYVNVSQLDMIQKYIGSDGAKIKLNKLGGNEWRHTKSKAQKVVKEIAKDLLDLYAARQNSTGFEYSKDNEWQEEFEEAFPYQETDDQLKAIDDVKQDMESSRIMDRLICGDVGYGKTEVALRAAFKAVQDGKQVGYLVPTTILAEQHYNTFEERMKDFPVNVDMLSRFRTPKQQQETLKKLKKGDVDIVIGTHRLLSADVEFKNLGLIIIDEEQRFGVVHKEKLKSIRTNTDVITLSATPIPRTLHLSLTGVRDMSRLEEPPLERLPVQTYVLESNQEFIKEAIVREIKRDGQVFYLYNRVHNIGQIASKIQALVPDAVVGYAHGQMSERELEQIMSEFVNGEINVLVCTTIIETGLDISNANTIIIENADYMGLSQLYQLRGRVGRSNRQAYAYLLYKRDKVLREIAEKRLQTIREFTEFGSGYKIALRDLELRGAGNLLGSEQHGHMEAVGYDLYCKLLSHAIDELSGKEISEEFETSIDLKIDAFIPTSYIANEEQKLEIYRKISMISDEDDYFDVQEEIEDRFGDIPRTVQNLLQVSLLKAYAHLISVFSVIGKSNIINLKFKADADINLSKLMELINNSNNAFSLKAGTNPLLIYKFEIDKSGYMDKLIEFLKNLYESGKVVTK